MRSGKVRLWITLLFISSCLSGCVPQLVAEYDPQTMNDFLNLSRKIDIFYSVLLETDKDQQQYEKFGKGYVEIEADFRMLLLKNKLRPFNHETVRQIDIAMELWQEDKQKHKTKNGVSDFIIKRHRTQFSEVFLEMIKAEKAKDI